MARRFSPAPRLTVHTSSQAEMFAASSAGLLLQELAAYGVRDVYVELRVVGHHHGTFILSRSERASIVEVIGQWLWIMSKFPASRVFCTAAENGKPAL